MGLLDKALESQKERTLSHEAEAGQAEDGKKKVR